MKKNKMMRIAAVLLIVTLLSTCAISGTFAKYVAKADVEDSARVAKWGIKIETTSNLFSDKYEAQDEDYIAAGGEYSVISDNGDMVVAPGTSSDQLENGGFSAILSGKPEVATRFQLKVDLNDVKDVYMPFAEGYTDYSVAVVDGEEQTFDLVGPGAVGGLNNSYVYGYAPVKWDITVTRVKADGTDGRSISLSEMASEVAGSSFGELFESLFTKDGISITDAMTVINQVYEREDLGLKDMIMEKVNEQFANHGFRNLQIDVTPEGIITLGMDFDPLENCNYRFDAKWAWDFEVDDDEVPSFITDGAAYKTMIDKADTYLGNVAAGIIEDDTVSTDLAFKFEASATQID